MKFQVFFTLLSVALAKPTPGGLFSGGWGHGLSSLDLFHQPTFSVAQPSYTVAQPVVHAAPVIQAAPVVHAAPVAVAKPATSYASFQQIVHPVSVAQPVVHAAPVAIAQPVVHAAPVVQTIAQPVVQKYLSLGSYGHGW
ncbi:cuticle protein 70, isoforms A and B-like [Battus philenor]|uniref:cuticle protein 70, isoforms A and B-like n=1 Tax=Battus philenor TaxID=42288 RepID=UPI0035D11AB0